MVAVKNGSPSDTIGALRDALGSISNLEQLLSSRNVAAKTVGKVLPDVLSGCGPLQFSLDQLIEGPLAPYLVPDHAAHLRSFLHQQLETLAKGLVQASPNGRMMTASARLSLERCVRRVERNLASTLPVLEVLASAPPTRQPIDIIELLILSRAGDQPQTPRARKINASLHSHSRSCRFLANPKAALALLGVAGSCIATKKETHLIVELAVEGDNVSLTLSTGAPRPHQFELLLPPKTEITELGLAAAARLFDVTVQTTEKGLQLSWLSGQSMGALATTDEAG